MKPQTFAAACALLACALLLPLPGGAQQPTTVSAEALSRQQLERHPALVSAASALRAAEQRLTVAQNNSRPTTVFLNAEEIAVSATSRANVVVGLEHEFTPSAERRADVKVAEAEIAMRRARLASVQLSIFSRAERAFVSLAVHNRVIVRLAQEDSLLQRATQTLNARFSVGDARYIDVIRLRTERLRIQTEIVEARIITSKSLSELRSLVNGDLTEEFQSLLRIRLPVFPSSLDSAILSSPAAVMAQAEQQRAAAIVEVARARGARVWTGSLGIQRFEAEPNRMTVGPALGASVTLPMKNRRALQLSVEAAVLDSVAVAQSVSAKLLELKQGVSSAMALVEAVRARINSVDQQLINAAREEREAALAAYSSGELTLAELLDFERSLSRSEIQLLEAYSAAIEAWDNANQLLAGRGSALVESNDE